MEQQRDLPFTGLHEFLDRPAAVALVGKRQYRPQRIGCRVVIPIPLVVERHAHFCSFSIAASRSVPLCFRIFAHRSPAFFTRAWMVSIVKSCGFGRWRTSFQVSGVDTPANALPRAL